MIKFSMILADTPRSRAYIQNLLKNNFIPTDVLVLQPIKREEFKLKEHYIKTLEIGFNGGKSVIESLEEFDISYKIISEDINKEAKEISLLKEELVVYSGKSGVILKEALVDNKKIIHIHPGILPKFRGSTTIYYSYLIEKKFGASVIVFNEEIDGGDILYEEEFVIEEKIDFDYVLDPLIRAKTLINAFKKGFNRKSQKEEGNMFFIIHPYLKHLTLKEYNDKS